MCRSTEIHRFYQSERNRLKIKAFYLRLLLASSKTRKSLPESLTLLYLPRINGNPLDIDELNIRSDSPGFVTLYRVRSEEERDGGEAIYASRERVKASEGVRFEVYWNEEKVLKGIFRKDFEDEDWKMECRCALEGELVGVKVPEVEVCVAVDGHVAMIEKVKMVVKRRRRLHRGSGFKVLDEIPEEREEGEFESGSDESCCCDCEFESGSDGSCCGEEKMTEEEGGGKWAVDVGFWVMCLGVGYLVSKASSRSLRRRRVFGS